MAFRSVGTGSTATNTAPTTNAPAGVALNDIVVQFIWTNGSSTPITWASGFTLILEVTGTAPNRDNGQNQLHAAWKLATGSEPGTYVNSISGANTWQGFSACWSGRNTTTPITASASTNAAGTVSPVTYALNGVTAANSDDLIWFPSEFGVNVGTAVWTPPSGYTSRITYQPGGTASPGQNLSTKDNVASGATGTLTGTETGADGDIVGLVIALASSGAGGFTLSSASGSYTYTGNAATLSQGTTVFSLMAAPGAYNYIGAPANSGFQLDVSAGIYSYIGQAATLANVGAFTLTAGAGVYSYVGEAAILSAALGGFLLSANAGIFQYAGNPAAFIVVNAISGIQCITNFEIIADAYQLIGVIDENSSPSYEQGVTALSVLNDYLLNEAADGMRLGWFRQTSLQACTPLKDEDVYGVKILLALQLAARYGITVQNQQLLEAGITAKTQLVKRALRYSEADFSEFPRPQGGPWGGPSWI